MTTAGGMRPIVRGGAAVFALPLLAALVLAAPVGARAAAGEAQLLSHGSAETYWVARVYEDASRGGSFSTDVYVRAAGDADWRQVARVDGRAVQLAHRGGQLAVLLDGGGWLLVSGETVATGRPPPPGARLLGLAPWSDTLVALARVYEPRPGQSPPPATRPAAAPAAGGRSTPNAERLALLTLTPHGWVDAGGFDVAGPLPGTSADASLAVVEGTAYVAVREGPASIAVYRQAGAARAAPDVETARPIAAFKLLGGGPVPVLWTLEAEGAPWLHWLTAGRGRSVAIETGAGNRPPATAAYAFDRVRVLYGPGLVLAERVFDGLSGAPGEASTVRLPRAPGGPPLGEWLQSLLPVLLLFTIIASLRRRREMRETLESADQLPLAPFGRRLLAGAIDAAPVLAAAAVFAWWEWRAEQAGEPPFDWRSQVVLLAGLLVYLLHTTASEIASGRTLGKLCCGLRVVGLDGRRPTAGALLTRNLLRLIDLSMMFFPLVLVLYSPLRQRAGDVAAGTLVVLNRTGAEAVTDEAHGAAPAAGREKVAEPAELTD